MSSNLFKRFKCPTRRITLSEGTSARFTEQSPPNGHRTTRLKPVTYESLPMLIGRKRKSDKPVIHIKKRKRRKLGSRADLTKGQKREVFFLFYPQARNAKGQSKSYPCIICQENMMVLNGTMSWNASHIRPIRHCPERDPKYALPTCTSCNGKMGIGKESYKNAFDMMADRGFEDRIYPIAKTLRERYDEKGVTVLQFVYDNYGRATRNQQGHMDSYLIIKNPKVYEIIVQCESDEIEKEMDYEFESKSNKIKRIHGKIKDLLSQVEAIREEEKQALIRKYEIEKKYSEIRERIFDYSGLF